MRRRLFLAGLAAGSLLPAAVFAQQLTKAYRIGYLSNDAAPLLEAQQSELMWRTLRELGYVEGANLVIERRYAAAREERLSAMAVELVALKPDLIFAVGGEAADATSLATRSIPIVVMAVGDPIAIGLVFSLARPRGNVTGVTEVPTDLGVKRLELLRETVPTVARVAWVYNSADRGWFLRYARLEAAAKTLGVAIPNFAVGEFAALERERPDAMIIATDALTLLGQRRVIDFAERTRLPVVYELSEPVYRGGLMSYGSSMADMTKRCAYFVDRILKGADPSDLPMEQPTRLYLVLNTKTAKALGLTIPPSILARADEVIE